MATDGPADPAARGATAAESEGSIFDKLRSPNKTGGQAQGDLASGERAPDVTAPGDRQQRTDGASQALAADEEQAAAAGHTPVDSARTNTRVLEASRAAGGVVASSAGTRAVDVQGPRIEDRDPRAEKRAERQVAFWFAMVPVGLIAFFIVFVWGSRTKQYYTPALGSAMGLSLLGMGVGAVLWAKKLMPDEEAVQEREPHFSPERDRDAAQETFRKGVAESGFAARGLVRRSLLGAGAALGLLALIPLRALAKQTSNQAAGELAKTHWREGARLIDSIKRTPVRLGDLAVGALLTVIPEGTEDSLAHQADSVAMLIRMRPDELALPPDRKGLDFKGHVVYSKLCTHLGCPVSLYEQQTHRLLCPCHQSQFLATEGARPIFGPAARALPQLALGVDEQGYFVSRSRDFTAPVGPGFWERSEDR